MLFAVEIGASEIGTAIVVAIPAIGATAALVDRRRKELTETYKQLYEAKSAENREQEQRMSRMEARVELLESNFVQQVARGVADAIVQLVKDEDLHEH